MCEQCEQGNHASCPSQQMEGSQQVYTDGQGSYTMVTTTIKCCDGTVINQYNHRQ
ncbi:hypothetical protein [Thermosporothrix hazakensis]|uniref:Uncharacterized protein n=1 Tax=Thermosporothrix sp. COM3 TaxID=2490863 RepID=A0A455SJR7_9CHLR|nr:hypothetical protein [Thermosporothrix hazakensis]BBH87598.1 hypothetical protein KTC_23490 [Thermosporothrix sp. COM3]GCE50028.1 hypothetical protein KTH_48970 [Thermosporothrix hazakensis]